MLRKQHRPREPPEDETFRVIDQRGAARDIRVDVFGRQMKQLQHDLRADFIDDLTRQRRASTPVARHLTTSLYTFLSPGVQLSTCVLRH
jgi:hypothetical protein